MCLLCASDGALSKMRKRIMQKTNAAVYIFVLPLWRLLTNDL